MYFCAKVSGKVRGTLKCMCFCHQKISTTFSHLIVATVFVLNPGDTCVGAKPTPEIYSTRNILLSSESVFIVEFTLKCDNNAKV